MLHTHDFIEFWKQLKPTELAFVDESHSITFRETDLYTRRIAFYLMQFGLKRGEIVCLILPTYLGWLFSLSLHRLGIATMSKNNLSAFSPELKPDWLISLEPHDQMDPSHTLIINEAELDKLNKLRPLQELEGVDAPNEIAAFFSTSGTTGDMKWTAHTKKELLEIALRPGTDDSFGGEGVLSLLNFGAAWVNFHALKCLVFGKTFYSCMFMNYKLPKFARENNISTLIGSPVQISSFLDIQKQTGTELPALKTIIMGGSPPSEKLVDRIKVRTTARIYNSYGSTESGHIAIYEIRGKNEQGAWIRPPVTLQIVDDNDQPLPAMSVGHIRYKRPGMATSYYNNPEATAQYFRDGFFYPGDLAYLDHAGRLVLQGRSNEVINLGGVKINPERIDAIALTQSGIQDCAAFAHLNESGVEELAIALVVDEGFDKEGFEKAMSKDSPYPIRRATIVKEIPRNENGKILRNLLAKG